MKGRQNTGAGERDLEREPPRGLFPDWPPEDQKSLHILTAIPGEKNAGGALSRTPGEPRPASETAARPFLGRAAGFCPGGTTDKRGGEKRGEGKKENGERGREKGKRRERKGKRKTKRGRVKDGD